MASELSSMEWLAEVLTQIKDARIAEEQAKYDRALQLYEQAMKYLTCINILKNDMHDQASISTLIHILCGQQLINIKKLKMTSVSDQDQYTRCSSSLKNPIVAKYGSSELNLTQSLPAIKVSNVPDEKCSLIKTKDRFPNYDCVVGSILHAMNYDSRVSEELYDQLMECLIHLKKSKSASTNKHHRREWDQKMLNHTAGSTTSLNVEVKRSRRLHKVKKFVSKKLKRRNEKKLKEADSLSDGASIYSGSSDAESTVQTMMKVHSLTRKAQEAETRQKYDLALSLYREAEGHFINTLKYEPSSGLVKNTICSTCGTVLPYTGEQMEDYDFEDHMCSRCLAMSCESLFSIASIQLIKVCLLPITGLEEDVIEEAVEFGDPSVQWCSVIGLHATKQAIKNSITRVQFPITMLAAKQKKTCTGILLYGPSGTGKSYLANAIANEMETNFYYLNFVYFDGYSKECLITMRDMFKHASQQNLAVIFIDELELLCTACNSLVREEFVNQMQYENDGITVVAATNTPFALDTKVQQCFQSILSTTLPGEDSRRTMLQLYVGTLPASLTHGHYDTLARTTKGYSGADIKSLVREAAMMSVRKLQTATHFKVVVSSSSTKPGTKKDYVVPCSRRDFGSIAMNWKSVSRDRLFEQPLCMDDFLKAASIVKPTTSISAIRRLEKWRKEQATICAIELT